MTGNEAPDLIAKTLARLDPDGTLRVRGAKKAGAKSPPSSPSHVPTSADIDRRVRKWIAAGPPAVSGQGGHNRTFEVAQAVVNGFCLDRADAIAVMMSEFVPMSPPDDRWSLAEIEHKVDDAIRNPCDKPRGWLRDAVLPPLFRTTVEVGHPVPTGDPFKPGLPSIVQQPAQLRDVVNQAIAALVKGNDPITTFVHGGVLVRIDTATSGGSVVPLTKPQLRLALSHSANWFNQSTTKEGEAVNKAAIPKSEAVESVQDHLGWPGLPRLTALADVPVITAESGLLTQPGFDPASGVYLLPGGYAEVPPVSKSPTSQDVEIARSLIMDELLGDFPFADDASRANALALFLLPFVRRLIDAPTPLHHVDAPQEGTGKSLLIQTWGYVALGEEPKALGEVTRADDWQKLILAALIEGPRSIFLDNLNNTLDSGALASALTSKTVGGRLLGFSRMVSAPVNCVWLSSGNNVRMSREFVRRTLYIRLDAKRDTAWRGRTFRHKLPQWAQLNRGELVWACLTMCQAWVAAGMRPGRQLIGGYEAWSAAMDGILCNAGVGDLLGNMESFRTTVVEADDEWRSFIPLWWERYNSSSVTAIDLGELAECEGMLSGVLKDVKTDRARGVTIGNSLKSIRDRFYGDIKVEYVGKDYKSRAKYRLVKEDVGGSEPDEPAELGL